MGLNCTKLTLSCEIWIARSATFIIDGFLFIILDVTCNLGWYVQDQGDIGGAEEAYPFRRVECF